MPTHPENIKRAGFARIGLEASFDTLHPDDQQDAIADMIGNLMHLAASMGFDPRQLKDRGVEMFEFEASPDYQGD